MVIKPIVEAVAGAIGYMHPRVEGAYQTVRYGSYEWLAVNDLGKIPGTNQVRRLKVREANNAQA